MKSVRFLAWAFVFFSISGCSVTVGPHSTDEQPGKAQSDSLNGLTPSAAFNQFLYQVEGSCSDLSHFAFKSVSFSSLSSLSLGTDSVSNLQIKGDLSFYMKAGGTADIYYHEYEVQSCGDGCSVVEHERMSRWYAVTWQVVGDELVIQNVGTAGYETYNDQPALFLKISNDFISPLAAGKETTGMVVRSNTGDQGISINQSCSVQSPSP